MCPRNFFFRPVEIFQHVTHAFEPQRVLGQRSSQLLIASFKLRYTASSLVGSRKRFLQEVPRFKLVLHSGQGITLQLTLPKVVTFWVLQRVFKPAGTTRAILTTQ